MATMFFLAGLVMLCVAALFVIWLWKWDVEMKKVDRERAEERAREKIMIAKRIRYFKDN